MTCQDLIGFLHEYLGGGLPEAERAVFDHHLKICPSCVAYLRGYRRTIALSREVMQESESPPMPEALVRAIVEAKASRGQTG